MADITELNARLLSDVARVAAHLLPGGRKEGHEWRAGSIAGEKGKSLGVHLVGEKAGVWSDFASGQSGDLIDLWRLARGLDFVAALDEIKTFLGIADPVFEGPKKRKSYRKPEKPKCVVPENRVKDYLIEDRNIPGEVLPAFKIGEADGGATIIFPSFKDGELCFLKYLGVDRDEKGKKITRVEANCRPVLFGWQAMSNDSREVVIVEGEIDALSMHAYGHPALSVPFGGGTGAKQAWIEEEYSALERFEIIYLAMDMDDEGQAAAAEIANRLGRHRCRIVELPLKDANECLMEGISKEAIDHCFRTARTLDPVELRGAGEYSDAVVKSFFPVEGEEPGYNPPWSNLIGRVRFRPAELTLWQGATGAGKSQALSHVCVDLIAQGARICIASLEMSPGMLLKRMVRQAGGVGRPTEAFIRSIFDWMAGSLWLFSVVGKSKVDRLLEVFEYARRRYGVDVFVIDSFMRLGISPDDYKAQEDAIFKIVDWALAGDVHIHLVAHSRKGDRQRGDGIPGAEDVKGTSEIGSNAFNIIGVWRNRKHEEKQDELQRRADTGDTAAETELADLKQKPGVILNLAKQRNGDWEGRLALHFDRDSYQYRGKEDRSIRCYVPSDDLPPGDYGATP